MVVSAEGLGPLGTVEVQVGGGGGWGAAWVGGGVAMSVLFVCPLPPARSHQAQPPCGPVRAKAAMLGVPRQGLGRVATDLSSLGRTAASPCSDLPVSPSACS